MYRVCKTFEIESGHMLSKHAERCRFPHGHSRRIEFVLAAESLDENDMVCDFKWIKLAARDYLDRFDHALCVSAADPHLAKLRSFDERIVVFEEGDPTTERMARRLFEHLAGLLAAGAVYETAAGARYSIRPGVRLERVRVWETPSSWAEYSAEGTS